MNSRALPTLLRPYPPPPAHGPGGFTLIELLVAIGVIGILAALLLPVLATVKERARGIKCLANIKQFDYAFISYAHDNNDRLPAVTNGDWADHIPMSMTDQMLTQYGLTRDVLYCPSFPEFNNNAYWDNTGGAYWGPHRVVGYCNSLSGTHNVQTNFWVTTIAPTLVHEPPPPRMRNGYDHLSLPATVTLVADLVPSSQTLLYINTNGRVITLLSTNFTYYNVPGEDGVGDPTGPVTSLHANHMAPYQAVTQMNGDGVVTNTTQRLPAGGNEGFLDGNCHWVKFKDMQIRTVSGGDDPLFWW